jgi:hypothetical protein
VAIVGKSVYLARYTYETAPVLGLRISQTGELASSIQKMSPSEHARCLPLSSIRAKSSLV